MINNINLNYLKTFYILATSKSFFEASQRLYISQPGVSRCIKKLETILGVQLFFRTNDGVEITNEGMILFQYVENALAQINAGLKLLDSQKQLDNGKLVIGIPSHIASFFLLEKLEKFRKDYPNISIEIISSSTKELLKSLAEHKLDFVIDSSPIDNISSNMIVEVLFSIETCFVSKKNIHLKDIKELNQYSLILPIKKSSVRKSLEKELYKFNITLNPTIEVETTDLIISSAKRNLGIGYVMKPAVKKDLEQGCLKIVDFPVALPNITINLIYVESCITYQARKFIKYYIKKQP